MCRGVRAVMCWEKTFASNLGLSRTKHRNPSFYPGLNPLDGTKIPDGRAGQPTNPVHPVHAD
jgi:hypothetical protein